jgi:hypothetical protein
MLGRLLRLIWGDEVDRALRPILIVGFAGSLAGSAAWTFIGIWAIDGLDASSAQLGVYSCSPQRCRRRPGTGAATCRTTSGAAR